MKAGEEILVLARKDSEVFDPVGAGESACHAEGVSGMPFSPVPAGTMSGLSMTMGAVEPPVKFSPGGSSPGDKPGDRSKLLSPGLASVTQGQHIPVKPVAANNSPSQHEIFLQLLGLECEDKNALIRCCFLAAGLKPSVLQLGVSTWQLLLKSPRNGPWLKAWFKTNAELAPPYRGRDLFPIPLPPVGAANMLLKKLRRSQPGLIELGPEDLGLKTSVRRQKNEKLLREGCRQLWKCLVIGVLNGWAVNWNVSTIRGNSTLSSAQLEACAVIDKWVQEFCMSPVAQVKLPSYGELVQARAIDYSGEETVKALPLKLGELLPGLPVKGVAGSLDAAMAASPAVRQWVEDPQLTLKPECDWPDSLPRARINATKEDWYDICVTLVDRGILAPIDLGEVFSVQGQPVLNGAFAVEKKGLPGPNEKRVTRLIMNLVPSNSYQRLMEGDLKTLASSTSWCGLVLKPGETLLWSSDDQRGAFYAWRLPHKWRAYMTFKWPIPGERLGLGDRMIYLAASVIPMGWLNAVSLFQHLHRQIGMSPQPVGAGHDPDMEWRRDRPIPLDARGKVTSFVQFYLDDFDAPELLPSSVAKELKGTLNPAHLRQRAAYKRWNVGIAEDKSQVRESRVIRMGAEINGDKGLIYSPLQKKLEACYFTLWLCGQRCPALKARLMVLGRWVRIFEFRRPLMNLLQTSWPKGDLTWRRPLGNTAMCELLECIALSPIAGTDLKAQVDEVATCSDASTTGGGLCCSGGLTEEGLNMLQYAREAKGDSPAAFAPLGAMRVAQRRGPKVFVISLFNGISALMVGLCRLDVQVVGFASCEIDKECKKLVRKRWPGVIELGSIVDVSETSIETLAHSVGYQLDLVIIGGGSPCQDLSQLLSGGKGLAGARSRLFYEMPRLFKLTAKHFPCPCHFFVENVFSMTEHNRNQFSAELQVKPYLIDSKHFSWCKRPRLFWCSWNLTAADKEDLIDHGSYIEWKGPDLRPAEKHWVDLGCNHSGSGLLPTLTRALPRRTPPRDPAGLSQATSQAVKRWQADRHKFQVYWYENHNMVTKPDGTFRTLTLAEREKLMGFNPGYVSSVLNPKKTVEEQQVLGACMLGNSFNVHVIAFLMDNLFAQADSSYVPRQWSAMLKNDVAAPLGWCSNPVFSPSSKGDSLSQELIQEFMRGADKGGSDVKLSVGVPYRIKAWPRAGLRSQLFHWRIIHGYPWRHVAHINVLELQAMVNGLQWRLRKASQFNKRVLHLVDSQVLASVVVKGRSSSRRLFKALNKLNALAVAAGVYLSVGYLASEDNPSDIPSRWGPIKGKRKPGSKTAEAPRFKPKL